MKLETLFHSAYSKLNIAEIALQKIMKYLKFESFDEDDMPNIASGTGGTEIFLEWRGKELSEDSILNIMESQGYITPTDFDIIK